MSIRPEHARWFELLTTREDLTTAVEVLAATGSIELETQSDTHAVVNLQDLHERMEEYNRLARRYESYWPEVQPQASKISGSPNVMLDDALKKLLAWEQAALPLIQQLESLTGEQTELKLLETMLANMKGETLDFSILSGPVATLAARLFVLPAATRVEHQPGAVLTSRVNTESGDFLLAVGTVADLDTLGAELAISKGREVAVPGYLSGTRKRALQQVRQRLEGLDAELGRIRSRIEALAAPHSLHEALACMGRLDWFLTHVTSMPVSENFAWITGWTNDLDDNRLSSALRDARVNAVIHFPPPPQETEAPMVMQNPWWAQPFELFASMLGTPARDEADPSRMLAVLAPLLFGYMFGDVGHGLVLLVAGFVLQHRWPVARLLIANGIAAIVFGFVFGSVFGREDIIPALWLHPVEDPLPVLLVPLAGGIIILLLGLLLNAVESYWRGKIRQWWQIEAAVLVLYLSLIASFFVSAAWIVVAGALIWYFTGCLLQPHARFWSTLPGAAGTLIESVLQLLINTVSFVRVGAFALAHGGLSLAFNIMAAATDNLLFGFLILLVGNAVVILLEGLVVTIQTTRLILFEFFIRFLRGSGRMFHPLTAPGSGVPIRRI